MAGGGELTLRMGPATAGPSVLIVPPLFEEANRTRRTLVMAMRALAAQGIASVLPDLPGQNESLLPTEAADLALWRRTLAEVAAALAGPVIVVSVRGGTLIDAVPTAAGWWRLAETSGASLLRTMLRARVASDREAGIASSMETLLAEGSDAPLTLAGNRLSSAMIAQLQAAEPAAVTPLRTRTLGGGADAIPGTPLWLRAEPGEDAALAAAIAADIAAWTEQCATR